MKTMICTLALLLSAAWAAAQQTPMQPTTKQPVYSPPVAPPTETLPKAEPLPTAPQPSYTPPPDVNAVQPNKAQAVPNKALSDFEAEMQSQQKGSIQKATSAQPTDFDAVEPPKEPQPQVQPPKTRD